MISIDRGFVLAEGVRGEVHEDRPRGEDHVAVALAVRGGLVAGAEDTRVTVTEVGSLGGGRGLWGAGRGAKVSSDRSPPGESLALLPL